MAQIVRAPVSLEWPSSDSLTRNCSRKRPQRSEAQTGNAKNANDQQTNWLHASYEACVLVLTL